MNALRVAVVAAACALAGCASPGDVMHRAPTMTLQSDKPVVQVAGCAAPRLLDAWKLTRVLPANGGQTIVVSGSAWGDALAVVTITTDGDGSRVTMRRARFPVSSDRITRDIEKTMRACI